MTYKEVETQGTICMICDLCNSSEVHLTVSKVHTAIDALKVFDVKVAKGEGVILSTKFYLMNPTEKCRPATW